MEIFISGSQVCEKKNTFGLGVFSNTYFQEPGSPWGTEFRPGPLLWWGKCLLAKGLGSPSTAFVPSVDMSWVGSEHLRRATHPCWRHLWDTPTCPTPTPPLLSQCEDTTPFTGLSLNVQVEKVAKWLHWYSSQNPLTSNPACTTHHICNMRSYFGGVIAKGNRRVVILQLCAQVGYILRRHIPWRWGWRGIYLYKHSGKASAWDKMIVMTLWGTQLNKDLSFLNKK